MSQQRYLPFGQVRTDVGTVSETDFGYTGQRALGDLGLMDYHARMYDAALGRFVQPDSLIPALSNPQSWNRYTYTYNSPISLNDPSGHIGLTPPHLGCDTDYLGTCAQLGAALKHISNQPKRNGGNRNDVTIGQNPNPPIQFDTKDIFDQFLPYYSAEDLRNLGTLGDNIALGLDIGAEAASVIGILGGAVLSSFIGAEGTLAGAGIGYGLAQAIDKIPLTISNGFSVIATYVSILADAKTGETGISGSLSYSASGISINANMHSSSNTEISSHLTELGLVSPISETSVVLQYLSTLNDQGKSPPIVSYLYSATSTNVSLNISNPFNH